MKKTLIFTMLFVCVFVNSQNKRLLIGYSVQFEGEFLDEKAKRETPSIIDVYSGIEDKLNTIKFELYYDNGLSVFKSIPEMVLDNDPSGVVVARILSGANNIYYRDINNKKLVVTNGDLGHSIDMDYSKLIWNITKDEKIIDGFTCLKATTKDYRRSKEIVVWFCPEIPFSAGPIEYGGLPGLILELYFGQIKYLATSVNLNYNKKQKIELPKKTISEEELSKILEKMKQNREGK